MKSQVLFPIYSQQKADLYSPDDIPVVIALWIHALTHAVDYRGSA